MYRTTNTLARIKAVAPNCACSHYILRHHTLEVKERKKIPLSLKNVLDEIVQIITIKSLR